MEGHQRNLYLYERFNTQVVGVSRDDVTILHYWKDDLGLTIPLLSNVSAYLGVLFDAQPENLPFFSRRTVIIDKKGIIRYVRDAMVFEIDEPPVLCGRNLGANPVEYLLVALSGCLTTSLIAHSAARGVQIRKVSSRYEGDLDLRGFLGISEEVPVGYQEIRVYFEIDADVSDEKKEELIRMAQKYSPVFNSIAKPVPVSVLLEKK